MFIKNSLQEELRYESPIIKYTCTSFTVWYTVYPCDKTQSLGELPSNTKLQASQHNVKLKYIDTELEYSNSMSPLFGFYKSDHDCQVCSILIFFLCTYGIKSIRVSLVEDEKMSYRPNRNFRFCNTANEIRHEFTLATIHSQMLIITLLWEYN